MTELLDIIVKSNPKIRYNKIEFNHTTKGKQEIFVITHLDMEKYLSNDPGQNSQYFVDSTFKCMPNKFKGFKVRIICEYENLEKRTVLCALILYKYMDIQSYYKLYRILNSLYNFNPKLICVDFQKSDIVALNKAFDGIKIITCFYHYTASLIKKALKLNFFDKSNSINQKTENYELILNLQVLCFALFNKKNSSNFIQKLKKILQHFLKKNS